VESVMQQITSKPASNIETVINADSDSRAIAHEIVSKLSLNKTGS